MARKFVDPYNSTRAVRVSKRPDAEDDLCISVTETSDSVRDELNVFLPGPDAIAFATAILRAAHRAPDVE